MCWIEREIYGLILPPNSLISISFKAGTGSSYATEVSRVQEAYSKRFKIKCFTLFLNTLALIKKSYL